MGIRQSVLPLVLKNPFHATISQIWSNISHRHIHSIYLEYILASTRKNVDFSICSCHSTQIFVLAICSMSSSLNDAVITNFSKDRFGIPWCDAEDSINIVGNTHYNIVLCFGSTMPFVSSITVISMQRDAIRGDPQDMRRILRDAIYSTVCHHAPVPLVLSFQRGSHQSTLVSFWINFQDMPSRLWNGIDTAIHRIDISTMIFPNHFSLFIRNLRIFVLVKFFIWNW
mmetsp:Transcript_50/g.105  ORF Transcript_50/g.105 Transcript_50/m.105 type:complete len:227 (-) Transcript_50:152-832(-)